MSMPGSPWGQPQYPGAPGYHGALPPPPSAGDPATGAATTLRRGPSRGAWIAAVVVMLVVGAAAGTAGFLVKRSWGTGSFVSCGLASCLGDVDQARIEADLSARGFTCGKAVVLRDCTYRPVHRTYRVSFLNMNDGLSGVDASIYVTDEFPTSTQDANFMVWVAGQVFAGDEAAMDKVENWLRERVSSKTADELRVDGYRFRFTTVTQSSLGLHISAVTR